MTKARCTNQITRWRRPALAAGTVLFSAGLCAGPAAAALAAPSAPTVTINVPCDAAALTSAVNSATNGTVLVLPKGCTYNLVGGLTVNTGIHIVGNGDTIEPGVAGAVFSLITVTGNGDLQIFDAKLINATSPDVGGAISNVGGGLTVIDCTFKNDVAGGGGAINSLNGPLTVIDSTFSDNSSNAGVHAAGGAIEAINSATTIKTSSFFSNVSGGSNPKVGGGAIFTVGQTLTIIDSIFRGNSAPSGGAVFKDGDPLTILDSTFTDNTADPGYGGGLFANTLDGLIRDSKFNLNTAGTDGGGIEIVGDPVIRNTVIDQNKAADLGGGIYAPSVTLEMIGSTILRNTAGLGGGGIYWAGSLSLTSTLFTGNMPNNCVPTIAGC